MPRKRSKNKHLPERVYQKHGAFYFVDVNNKWHRLGKTLPEAMIAWSELIETSQDSITYMNHLFDRYMQEVAPVKSAKSYANNQIEIQSLRSVFGHVKPENIKPVDVYRFLDVRGQKAPIAANREKSLLSHVFTMAIRWGVVSNNPCLNVRRLKEKKRDRYVTDEEFYGVYELASPSIKSIMLFAYLTGLRQSDVLKIKLSDITDEGIFIEVSKTKNKLLIQWSDELLSIVDEAKKLNHTNSIFLFCTKKRSAYTPTGFRSIWQRLIVKAMAQGVISERFRFHDIRRKTASDIERQSDREQARKLLGHSDQKTTQIYISGVQSVRPLVIKNQVDFPK